MEQKAAETANLYHKEDIICACSSLRAQTQRIARRTQTKGAHILLECAIDCFCSRLSPS